MKRSAIGALAALFLATATPAWAQNAVPRTGLNKLNLEKSRLAIQGYDPVAYFPEAGGKPQKGKSSITTRFRGVEYRFATKANRDRFLANPSKYEPAYGGWCAWAMADNDRVEIDPDSFLIQDGELLLFFDGFFADTRKRWRKGNVEELKVAADRYWKQHYGAADRDLTRIHAPNGLALGGLDPVSVHDTKGKPLEGKATVPTLVYRGITYRFHSQENYRKFKASPADYEARVGAWDPIALGQGNWSAGTPTRRILHKNRLYLFASEQSMAIFQANPEQHAAAAEKAYQTLKSPQAK